MYIRIKDKVFKNLREFFDSDSTVGNVIFNNCNSIFMKVITKAGYTAIYRTILTDKVDIASNRGIYCYAVIDKNNKIILPLYYAKEIIKLFDDYTNPDWNSIILSTTNEILTSYIKDYEKTSLKLVNPKCTVEEKDVYKKVYEQGNFEHIKFVPFSTLNLLNDYACKANRPIEDIDNIIKFLVNDDFQKQFVVDIFNADLAKEGYLISNYRRIKETNKLLDEIKKKNDSKVLKRLAIISAVNKFSKDNPSAKTLNVIAKDDITYKVKPYIIASDSKGLPAVGTIVGWNYISLDDICKITYTKKIIYQE